jgi:hypothetical protein
MSVFIRQVRQLKTIVFLHWGLICAILLAKLHNIMLIVTLILLCRVSHFIVMLSVILLSVVAAFSTSLTMVVRKAKGKATWHLVLLCEIHTCLGYAGLFLR